MQAAQTPGAKQPPRRAPLRELRLQPGAEHTSLTPLLCRLRLKDRDCATPVSCAQPRPRRVAQVFCPSEPPRNAHLLPPNSITPVPCTPRLPSSSVLEPPGALTLGPNTSKSSLSPPLKPGAPEPSRSPTEVPNAPETPSSTKLEPPGSSTPETSTPEPPSTPVPVPLCSLLPGPCSPEALVSTVPEPCTLEPPRSPVPAPPCSSIPGPCSLETPVSTLPIPLCSPILGARTPELPDSAVLDPLCSPVSGPCSFKCPGSTVPVAPCSPILGLCAPEPTGTITPASPSIAISASCTLGPPGTSSTPQEAPFRGWRAVPTDLSCTPVAPKSPAGDGSAGPPSCQDAPEGTESQAPVPPEQGSPRPIPTEAGRSEHAGSEAMATPIPSPGVTHSAVSWVLPLVWLEKSLNTSSLLETMRPSLLRWDAGTSVTPVPTVAAGTSVTPVPTVAAGTSVTPVPTAVASTSITPVPTTVTGTFMTPRDLRERSTNTSMGSLPRAKDSAAETDSLLWLCPREQLKSLPRVELEGRLESTLIIIEALALQLRDWQENQRLLPGVGPAEQRDALTQTDVTHPKGEEEIYHNLYLELRRKLEALQRQRGAEQDLQRELERASAGMGAWSQQCLLFRDLVDAAFQSLQDERGTLAQEREQMGALVSRCRTVVKTLPSKLRSCLEERDAMRQRADKALRAKEEGDCFLEAFRSHASARIAARDQSLATQRELGMLLADAIDQQASLAAEAQRFREFIDVTFENLEEERGALDAEREQMRTLVSRCRAVLDTLPSKLRSSLEERDAMRQRADEALQAKEEISCQLEETLVALQDAVAQLEQLKVANSRLGTDLSSVMINLAKVEQERDALQQENEKLWEEMACLGQERDKLHRECNGLCQELREATECREFLEQENHTSSTQLLEVEAKLNSTLATLQERSLQYKELMDSHQHLREEHAALGKELESTKAKLLDLQLKRDKVSWCSTDITESRMRLQELADCLRAALQEEEDDVPPGRPWTPAPRTLVWQTPRGAWTPACRTPYRAGSSFVGSVLKAVSGKDTDKDSGGGSAFSKGKHPSAPKQTEPEESLLESVKELKSMVSDLAMLSYRMQEREQSEFKALQTKISDLQLRLETVTDESQEKMDTQAATIAKLNKALRGKLESEKELQDVVKQQEEKMLQIIDKSGEVTRLKGELFHLRRSLQRAETEAKVLWEELRGQEPKVDTTHVQERVLLRQEVDKLRLLLLEKEEGNQLLSDKYLEQVRELELRLHHTQKLLRTHEEIQEKMKEVLLTVPEVAGRCQELHSLLRYLGLKPDSSSEEAAELQ